MTQQEIDRRVKAATIQPLNIRLAKMELLPGAEGITAKDEQGYLVVINSMLPEDKQAAAFIHEMLHIWHDDFSGDAPAGQLESYRHAEAIRLCNIFKQQEAAAMQDINGKLQEAYRINAQDAAALVKLFEETGDAENLQRAQEDLKKWEEKQQRK